MRNLTQKSELLEHDLQMSRSDNLWLRSKVEKMETSLSEARNLNLSIQKELLKEKEMNRAKEKPQEVDHLKSQLEKSQKAILVLREALEKEKYQKKPPPVDIGPLERDLAKLKKESVEYQRQIRTVEEEKKELQKV